MGNKNRVAFFNILSTVVLNGISIFTSPLFSRMLGTSGYGVISTYTTWVSLIAIVFSLQVANTVANARVHYSEEEQNRYQSSVMGLSCLTYFLCSIPTLLFSKQIAGLLKVEQAMIPIMLIHAFGTNCIGFVTTRFSYEFKAGRNFLISISITISTIVLSVILIKQFPYELGYWGRILALAVVYGLFGIGSCLYILFKGKKIYNRKYWQFCIPIAIPFVFHCLSDLLLGHSDRLMLKQLGTDSMVGQYSLAFNFAGIIYTIWTSLNNTWSPFYYEYMRKRQSDELRKAGRNYVELFTVLAIGFVLLETEVYHVFASKEFWNGTPLIPMFVVGHYMIFLSSFCVNYETFHKKTKIMAIGTIMATIVNVVLNYIWIQKFGLYGATLATMVSHSLQTLYHQILARRIGAKGEFVFTGRIMFPYVISFLAAAVFAMLTPNLWFVRWSMGAALGVWELNRIIKRKSIF